MSCWVEIKGQWINLQKVINVSFGSQCVVFNYSGPITFAISFKDKEEAGQIKEFIIDRLESNYSHCHFEMKEPEIPKKKEKKELSGYFQKTDFIPRKQKD